jgi:CubicO group peptidase (beta-lactamase class C family)
MSTSLRRLSPILILSSLACVFCLWATSSQNGPVALESSKAAMVDTLVEKFDHPDTPGVVVAVYRVGEIVYMKAAGMADLEHEDRLKPSSVFDIASMSKQFTAMAVVLLQQDGRLSLDDDVRKYVPEVHTDGKAVTIRQLLQHTSGIRDYLDLMDLGGNQPDNSVVSQQDVLDIISTQQHLNFNPGSAFRYENSSYALMATIIKRVSGKSLREFANDRIFSQLGMHSTRFRDNHTDVIKNRACGYEPRATGWSSVVPIYDEVGDGGVWTTVEDLAKWDANFYHPQVGGQEAVRVLLSQAILSNGLKMSYSLGLFVGHYRGFALVSHGGVDPGYRAEMLRFPDERITVTVLANNPDYDVEGLSRQIADVYLPKAPQAEKPPADLSPLPSVGSSALAGKYLDTAIGRTREIIQTNNTVNLRSRGKDYPLRQVGEKHFEDPSDNTTLIFQKDGDGRLHMTMSAEGQMPSVSVRLPDSQSPFEAAAYVGTYSSPELSVSWQIRRTESGLVLKRPHGEQEPLSALDKDEFASGSGLIHFLRSKENRIISFTVTNVRDSNVEFRRSTDSF